MSDFPTAPMARQRYATLKYRNGVVIDYTPQGEARGRDFGGAARREGAIVLDLLSESEKNSVLAHYEANKASDFAFTYASDGAAGTWRYIAPPVPEPVKGGWFNVTINVQEVPA